MAAIFPVFVADLKRRTCYVVRDAHALGTYLEFYDSSNSQDAATLRILSQDGRRLNVLVDRLDIKSLSIEDRGPWDEDIEILRTYTRVN